MKQIALLLFGCALVACQDKNQELGPQPIADFTMEIDGTDFYTVHFYNHSQNATSFYWDFDNGDSSLLENPIYTFAGGGFYEVTLTVTGVDGTRDSKTRDLIIIEKPDPQYSQLSGKESKTWKLYREGAAVSMGPDSSQPGSWWQDFYNDGSKSCLYKHEFIFKSDGTYVYDDKDVFWGDGEIWSSEDPVYESCFEPTASNMLVNGKDVSAWLSGTYSYDFDPVNEMVTLRGKGAWIGFPFLGTDSNHGSDLPDSITFQVHFENMPGFDLMTVMFDHGKNGFWTFRYANYEDWQKEPPLIE